MTVDGANSMIKTSAMVVGGVYLFRRFTEGTAEQEKRSRKLTPLGQFTIAWGVIFFSLSLLAPAAPGTAGNMALLVMVAALLTNGVEVSKDLGAGMQRSAKEQKLAARAAHRHGTPAGPRGPAGVEGEEAGLLFEPTHTERSTV